MNIAIIDDQDDIRYAIEKILSKDGHVCYEFKGDKDDIIDGFSVFKMDLVVLDMMLEDNVTGLDILTLLRANDFNIPTIMITAYTTPSNMIEASKSGVVDIIEKPFSSKVILDTVNKYKANSNKNDTIELTDGSEEFIGSFETMKDIYKKIGIASKSELNTLIYGETGTGKELVAKLIHKNSKNKSEPFVAVNCVAIPEQMFEILLFGDKNNIGYAQESNKGTLFLDEISELSLPLQGKLLRFLETKRFYPTGLTKEVEFEGKIISASLRNPKDLIGKNLFRDDLYHRISMLEIDMPSLQDRLSDLKLLIQYFINLANKEFNIAVKTIDEESIALLENHIFRGNIRELRNIIFKAVLNARNSNISIDILRPLLNNETKLQNFSIKPFCSDIINSYGIENANKILEDIEKEILCELYKRRPNISQLSEYLNISRNTLKNKIDKYKLTK